MRSTTHRVWQSRLTLVLALLVAGLSLALAHRHSLVMDWTATARHTLQPASREILDQLEQPLTVIAFTRDQQLAKTMASRMARYQRHSPLISFETINPDRQPAKAASAGIDQDGLLHLSLGDRTETLRQFDEQSVSNAILRLNRGRGVEIRVLAGHGERSITGQSNRDLTHFASALTQQGFSVSSYQIDPAGAIPTDNSLLLVSTAQSRLSGTEVAKLLAFIAEGGRLLWLGDPGELQGLKPLAIQLGLRFLPGTLVDPAGMQTAGSGAFALATSGAYRPHAITQDFQLTSVFPLATGLSQTGNRWQATPLAIIGQQGWMEQGDLTEAVAFDPQHDLLGPVTIALAMTHQPSTGVSDQRPAPQRVVVVGDGDFLANGYLANGGNRQLGLNMINWIAGDDHLINIEPVVAADTTLELSSTHAAVTGLGFLLIMPLLLAATGGIIWWRRR